MHSRRSLLMTGTGALGAAAVAPSFAWGASNLSKLPARGEFVIENAALVTVDPALGTIASGHIHVRNGDIVSVAAGPGPRGVRKIDGTGMIALPGFVDSHWHMWTGVFRAFVSPQMDYTAAKDKYARFYTPQDCDDNIRFGLLEAVNAGVTGVLNFAHNVISSAHADAEMTAHAECGVRSLYSYGQPWGIPGDQIMDLAGLEQTNAKWRSDPAVAAGMLKFGVSLRGRRVPAPLYAQEMAVAERLGLPVAYHGGSGANVVQADVLKAGGHLNSSTSITHYIEARQVDREAMRDAGVSLSWSTMGEIRNSEARAAILQFAAAGINISLSVDATTISPLDMFENMRTLLRYSVPGVGDARTAGLKPFTHAQVLQMATLNGARLIGMEKICGSLTPGKRADIVLLRTNDLNILGPGLGPDPVYSAVAYGRTENIDTVVIDGRIMKRAGKVVGLDSKSIEANAMRSIVNLRQRAGG